MCRQERGRVLRPRGRRGGDWVRLHPLQITGRTARPLKAQACLPANDQRRAASLANRWATSACNKAVARTRLSRESQAETTSA